MIGNHVPTPDWLQPFIKGMFDPFPLNGQGPIEPPKGKPIWVNPGFDSYDNGLIDKAIEWHRGGHFVALLVPIESSTQRAKKLIEYGCERLYFERRVFPECRGVEIVILTG